MQTTESRFRLWIASVWQWFGTLSAKLDFMDRKSRVKNRFLNPDEQTRCEHDRITYHTLVRVAGVLVRLTFAPMSIEIAVWSPRPSVASRWSILHLQRSYTGMLLCIYWKLSSCSLRVWLGPGGLILTWRNCCENGTDSTCRHICNLKYVYMLQMNHKLSLTSLEYADAVWGSIECMPLENKQ